MLNKVRALFKPILSREEFAERFARQFAASGRSCRFDAERFEIITEGGAVFLGNFYKEHLSLRGDRAAQERHIAEKAATMAAAQGDAVPEDWEGVAPRLLPSIRRRSDELAMLDGALNSGKFDGNRDKIKLLGHALGFTTIAALAFDTPKTIQVLTRDRSSSWGLSIDEIWAKALENLRDLAPDRWQTLSSGVYQSLWRDGYDTSRMFLTDMIRRLSIAGRPVAFLPTRDTLIIVGDRDDRGLLAASAYAADIFKEAPRPCTLEPFVLGDDDRWQTVASGTLLHEKLVHEALRDQTEIQGHSTAVLRKWLDFKQEEVFAAQLMQRQDGDQLRSLAVWPAVPCLLPRADELIIQVSERDGLRVAWEDLEFLNLLPEPEAEWWPARYRFESIPTSEQLAKLRELEAMRAQSTATDGLRP